ncbi:hypothetical protein [Maribacter forsetii]|uniref:hypothetical protein n=1 Tax=Maribacter forsetii TaxID=444515 RepID=UPI000560328C|nr:hypothetical protein [Maribacter forsetii]
MNGLEKQNGRTKNVFRIILGIGFLISSILAYGQESQILLKTDFDGKVTEGSLKTLIENIEKGESIRIGWQLDFNEDKIPDLEHWIDGEFLTIMNGHVFNQIQPIYAQAPMVEIPQVEISNSPLQWTAIIGTNGKLKSRYIYPDIEKEEDEEERKYLQEITQINERMVQTIWVKK